MDEREQMAPAAVEGEPLYNEEGVDLTLLDCALRLTPAERVDQLEALLNELLEIRAYVDKE